MSTLGSLFPPQYLREPPAFFHTRILVGPGGFLGDDFVKKHNITHVINCSFDMYSPAWWRNENPTKYKVLNAIDAQDVNILDWYPEFETTMKDFLRDGDGVVYVHCQAGMNRSASLALAYTAKNMSMDIDTLISSVKRQRPCILQNLVFMNQVKEFINGRVQDPKDQGITFFQQLDRYTGFFTSGDRSDLEGLKNATSGAPKGIERTQSGNITPMYFQRYNEHYEGKSA